MKYLKDIKVVYKKSLSDTIYKIKKNPVVLFFPLIFSVLISLSNRAFGSLLQVGGLYISFLTPVLYALILSIYLDMLSDLMYYDRVHIGNFKSSFRNYFGPIYSVYFVLILINWVVLMFFRSSYYLTYIIWTAIFLIFNPIVETIYLKDESYISAYSYCLNFMKDNFIHWLIPLVVYVGIQHFLGFSFLEYISDEAIITLPIGRGFSLDIFRGPASYYIKYLIVEIITGFYIIFRGNLFKILSNSTMRKRQYMGEI